MSASVRLPIATRGSALALWQADHVTALLADVVAREQSGETVEITKVIVETTADRRLDIPIYEMGGKGVFVKEVQAALLDGRARVAVHSGKDLPAETHPDLVVAAVPERGDPRDVLIGATLESLATGALVATGSIRRRVQLASRRPDLSFEGLRGNIATRLEKIPEGGAIVMAAAALTRLGLWDDINAMHAYEILEPSVMLPQVAQGALAIECRRDDAQALAWLAPLDHQPSRLAFDAERAFLSELGGDCDLPAGAYASRNDENEGDGAGISLEALLASLDGHRVIRASQHGTNPDELGRRVARYLLDNAGGAALLDR